MILGLMFESFGGRFDRKKLLDLGEWMGLIWKLMKIVCRGAGFLFHLMKQLFSAVNYRGNPRQLTAAGFQIPRQLTAEGVKGYFTCVSQPYGMCQQQFSEGNIVW